MPNLVGMSEKSYRIRRRRSSGMNRMWRCIVASHAVASPNRWNLNGDRMPDQEPSRHLDNGTQVLRIFATTDGRPAIKARPTFAFWVRDCVARWSGGVERRKKSESGRDGMVAVPSAR